MRSGLATAILILLLPVVIGILYSSNRTVDTFTNYGPAELAAAASSLKTVHFEGWYIDASGEREHLEGWVKYPGMLRLCTEDVDLLYDGEKLTEIYKGCFPYVTIREPSTFTFQKDGLSYLQFLTRTGFSNRWSEEGTTGLSRCRCVRTPDGRPGCNIEIDSLRLDTSVTIDENSGRIVSWTEHGPDGKLLGVVNFDGYDIPLPDRIFQQQIPESYAVLDLIHHSTYTKS